MKHLLLFQINVLLLLVLASVQVNGTKQQAYSLNDVKGRLQSLSDNLKKDESDLYKSEEELKKQIGVVVQKFSIPLDTVTEFVKCLNSLTKNQSGYEFSIKEFKDVISDIGSYGTTVQKSSTLRECVNGEIPKFSVITGTQCVIPEPQTHADMFKLLTLTFTKYEIVRNYNKHLLTHRFLTNIVNEDNRRKIKV
uniref:Nose resistant to fluoxetine protein 6 n=1 Tax=Schistosoma mansoni TaxID=6183 RepID=A0A5K4F902_SCHMA